MINVSPAVIASPVIEALELRQLATTTISIQWRSTQVYPKDLALKLYVDTSEIAPMFEDPDVREVPCVFRQTVIVTCEYPIDEPGVIKVTNLLLNEQSQNTELMLTLTRQKFLSETPVTTKSWRMQTFTDSRALYGID